MTYLSLDVINRPLQLPDNSIDRVVSLIGPNVDRRVAWRRDCRLRPVTEGCQAFIHPTAVDGLGQPLLNL